MIHPTPVSDFSGAHSMDTEWFAVDRDGHVAYFESGGSGVVPGAASYSTWPFRFLEAADLLGLHQNLPTANQRVGNPGNGKLLAQGAHTSRAIPCVQGD